MGITLDGRAGAGAHIQIPAATGAETLAGLGTNVTEWDFQEESSPKDPPQVNLSPLVKGKVDVFRLHLGLFVPSSLRLRRRDQIDMKSDIHRAGEILEAAIARGGQRRLNPSGDSDIVAGLEEMEFEAGLVPLPEVFRIGLRYHTPEPPIPGDRGL